MLYFYFLPQYLDYTPLYGPPHGLACSGCEGIQWMTPVKQRVKTIHCL